ncbi:S1 domain-containing RNA-binding protein [Bacillus taeanensis]|uniref:RNA-binding protein S1 n=1 Tax=Bacillus taeanensis TaxID=273032 RepID=A0A366XUL3_9BACI|nr:S1 domain-containing RNA-binding protein [Bacillus taeanensis]RBW67651.1 RNA-binding protein S1 [Bacillus taeanensis]
MSIEVGSKLKGKVTGITNFGAFVELPEGKTGLVHISEVADNYVKDINDHLTVGDEVEVKVIQLENDGKIGLSIKKAKDRPERPERSERPSRPAGNSNSRGFKRGGGGKKPGGPRGPQTLSFEDKLSRFLKDSEERLSTIKRQTDSKRGGRGSRRG